MKFTILIFTLLPPLSYEKGQACIVNDYEKDGPTLGLDLLNLLGKNNSDYYRNSSLYEKVHYLSISFNACISCSLKFSEFTTCCMYLPQWNFLLIDNDDQYLVVPKYTLDQIANTNNTIKGIDKHLVNPFTTTSFQN